MSEREGTNGAGSAGGAGFAEAPGGGADVVSGFAEVNGARLAWEARGRGQAVVLVHAGIADSRMWEAQVGPLSARYRVVRYDLRGFGRSTAKPGPYQHLTDLEGLLDHLGIEEAHLVGASFGGRIAIDFALERHDRVKSLVLLASAVDGVPPPDDLIARYEEVDAAVSAGDLARAVELELRLWVDGPRRSPRDVAKAVRDLVREMNTEVLKNALSLGLGEPLPLDFPASTRLMDIRAPALVVEGALDVRYMLTLGDILATAIPSARKVVIPDAAHMVSMERPEAVNRLILDFLEALAA